MQDKVRDTAEKIFVKNIDNCKDFEALEELVNLSVKAAKVFHQVCGKDVVRVGR